MTWEYARLPQQAVVAYTTPKDNEVFGECSRTWALYKPGTPIKGIGHRYVYSGQLPNTGAWRCVMCGFTSRRG